MRAGILAAAAVCLMLRPGAAAGDEELHAKIESGFVRITAGERPVLLYRYEGAPKPYVKELYTPKDVQVLLDSPPDHVHHRGLMFALAVNGVSFWEESEKAGKEVSRSINVGDRAQSTAFVEQIEWRSEQDKPLLRERRLICVWGGKCIAETGARLVGWQSMLDPAAGVDEARLTGSHYFGLGMRFVRSMDKDGTFILPDKAEGEVVRGNEKLYPGRWCAYTASVDGKPVTVAMFSHPSNKPAVTWFTMKDPFAYLSATLKLHKEPITLGAGQQLLCLTYAIAVWDGKVEPARIEEVYRLWLDLSGLSTTRESQAPQHE